MPGEKLHPLLLEPTPLEEVDLTVIVGVEETTEFCGNKMLELGMYKTFTFNLIANFGIQFGCALYEIVDGKVKKCDVYVAWEWYLLDHELRHCMGYKDVWY